MDKRSVDHRIRELERAHGEKPCPVCGGRTIHEVVYEDGRTEYPLGEPCPACENAVRVEVLYE